VSNPGQTSEFVVGFTRTTRTRFNSISNFEIRIAKLTDVSLIVYDLLGREIAIIVNDRLAPGNYTRQWDATGLPSGVYFFRLRAGGEIHSKRLILAR